MALRWLIIVGVAWVAEEFDCSVFDGSDCKQIIRIKGQVWVFPIADFYYEIVY